MEDCLNELKFKVIYTYTAINSKVVIFHSQSPVFKNVLNKFCLPL